MLKRTATALSYERNDAAPRVVAKGRGREADRILECARNAGVHVVEDAALAALLEFTDLGEYIDEACWEAVARILAFVMAEDKEQ